MPQTEDSLSKFYNNTRFNPEYKSQLHSSFLEFADLWTITIVLIRDNFKNIFLIPSFWKILIQFLGSILIWILVFFSHYSVFTQQAFFTFKYWPTKNDSVLETPSTTESQLSKPYEQQSIDNAATYLSQDLNGEYNALNSEKFRSELSNFFVENYILILAIIAISILVYLAQALITIKQTYIINDAKINSVWNTPKSFYLELGKIIVISLGFGVLNIIFNIILETFGLSIISDFLDLIFWTVIFGYLGLYTSFIIYEELEPGDSLKLSFSLSKPFFWSNILRWAQLYLVLAIIGVAAMIITFVLAIIGYFTLIGIEYSVLPLVLLIFSVIFSLYLWVWIVVFQSIILTFGYVSFYNLRMIGANTKAVLNIENPNLVSDNNDETHDETKPKHKKPLKRSKRSKPEEVELNLEN